MMREIRFKGKRIDNGECVYWNRFGEYAEPQVFKDGMHSHVSEYDVHLKTVGQYTGLKDKNEIEIYEGDIVEFGKFKCEVCYLDESYVLKKLESKCTEYYKPGIVKFNKLEIIGNIHDKK